MKIYDEITREEILVPDLALGYVYDGHIVTDRTEERYEVMEGKKRRRRKSNCFVRLTRRTIRCTTGRNRFVNNVYKQI